MTRRFPTTTVAVKNGRRRVHRIQCSECPVSHDVSVNTWGGHRANEDLMTIWKRGGWTVGRNPAHDLCPNCTGKRLRRRKAAVQEAPLPLPPPTTPSALPDAPNDLELTILEDTEMTRVKSAPKVGGKPVVAEPPRAPTFDEKRIILSKLHDVYVDESTGYGSGWSDKRVADDLGVPRAWVAELRDANFGPARDNEDAREALAQFEALAKEVRDLLASAERRATEAREVADRIERAAATIAGDLRRLEKTVEEVRKAVA